MFFCSLVNRFISAWLYAGSRNRRVLVFDVILLTCAVFLGYALRLTFFVNMGYWREMEKVALFYVTTLVTVMYIGKIYTEVKRRPRYFVDRKVGFKVSKEKSNNQLKHYYIYKQWKL